MPVGGWYFRVVGRVHLLRRESTRGWVGWLSTHWVGGEEGGFRNRWAACSPHPSRRGILFRPGESGTVVGRQAHLLVVRVPVLSEQMALAAPMVSQEERVRTRQLSCTAEVTGVRETHAAADGGGRGGVGGQRVWGGGGGRGIRVCVGREEGGRGGLEQTVNECDCGGRGGQRVQRGLSLGFPGVQRMCRCGRLWGWWCCWSLDHFRDMWYPEKWAFARSLLHCVGQDCSKVTSEGRWCCGNLNGGPEGQRFLAIQWDSWELCVAFTGEMGRQRTQTFPETHTGGMFARCAPGALPFY